MENVAFPASDAKAVETIKNFTADPSCFLVRTRGFLDYKFSELARYRGYEGACQYAESVLRWHDADKFSDTILVTSYAAFRAAERNLNNNII